MASPFLRVSRQLAWGHPATHLPWANFTQATTGGTAYIPPHRCQTQPVACPSHVHWACIQARATRPAPLVRTALRQKHSRREVAKNRAHRNGSLGLPATELSLEDDEYQQLTNNVAQDPRYSNRHSSSTTSNWETQILSHIFLHIHVTCLTVGISKILANRAQIFLERKSSVVAWCRLRLWKQPE